MLGTRYTRMVKTFLISHGFCCIEVFNCDMPSTVIASFEYDESSQELIITFISGVKYRYKDVPHDVYLQMKASREKGIYFNKKVRGKFHFEKSPDGNPPS